jgi:hypothetical protein
MANPWALPVCEENINRNRNPVIVNMFLIKVLIDLQTYGYFDKFKQYVVDFIVLRGL